MSKETREREGQGIFLTLGEFTIQLDTQYEWSQAITMSKWHINNTELPNTEILGEGGKGIKGKEWIWSPRATSSKSHDFRIDT